MIRINEAKCKSLDAHRDAIYFYAHCDSISAWMSKVTVPRVIDSSKRRSLGERSAVGHLDLPRLIDGGADCQIFAVWECFAHIPCSMQLH